MFPATRATGGGSDQGDQGGEESERDAVVEGKPQEQLQASGRGGDVASRFRESMTEAKLKNVYAGRIRRRGIMRGAMDLAVSFRGEPEGREEPSSDGTKVDVTRNHHQPRQAFSMR